MRNEINYKVAQVPWWVVVTNANWFTPEGPDSNIYKRFVPYELILIYE